MIVYTASPRQCEPGTGCGRGKFCECYTRELRYAEVTESDVLALITGGGVPLFDLTPIAGCKK